MPRGVEYTGDNQYSDNPIEGGQTKVHGTNPDYDHMNRVDRTAALPEDMGNPTPYSGQSSFGKRQHGSGKGGHEPKTLEEHKGLGAHKA
ncbi:uncharacterized protein BJX67DRAFT_384868 [Aspergillus lucknowensis]|uniref:Uncharacterized protein n=1 Tax=Aspergillus lucknowensis TaxID=176173 RepID=A0ABR4LFK2_9EURO